MLHRRDFRGVEDNGSMMSRTALDGDCLRGLRGAGLRCSNPLSWRVMLPELFAVPPMPDVRSMSADKRYSGTVDESISLTGITATPFRRQF